MRLQDELTRVEKAEDVFALFGLSFDERVLRVHRLHVMQRFGRAVAQIDRTAPALADDERWACYAAALQRSHDHYLDGPPAGAHDFAGVQRGLVTLGTPRKV